MFNKISGLALVVLAGVAWVGCGDEQSQPAEDTLVAQGKARFGESFPGRLLGNLPEAIEDPDATEADLAELVSNNTDYAFEGYSFATEELVDKNIIYSPYSISNAFAMALPVANSAEPVIRNLHLEQPQDKLHPSMNLLRQSFERHAQVDLRGDEGEPFVLNIANGVWVTESLSEDLAENEALLSIFGGHYDAPVAALPFFSDPAGSEALINAWVSDRTEGMIPMLLQDNIKPESYYVLVNALFFKASWQKPFSEFATRPAAFQAPGGEVQAETMAVNASFAYVETEELRAVSLPYISDGMQMMVVMPTGDFEAFEAGWTPQRWQQVRGQMGSGDLALKMPKFAIESALDLSEYLEDPFSSARHQATIEVDEKGTVASAATVVEVGGNSEPEFSPLAIDRPFLFVIYDTSTEAVLFMGRVLDPTK